MSEAYFSHEKRMVDPYFNDVVGMTRSFKYLEKQKINRKVKLDMRKAIFITTFNYHSKLMLKTSLKTVSKKITRSKL